MSFALGDGCAVLIGSGLVGSPAGPEFLEGLRVAEGVGSQLQDGVGVVFAPELFRPFHAGVDLLDCRLDVDARQRQTLLAIFGRVHVAFVVCVIRQRAVDALPRIGFADVFLRQDETFLVRLQFVDHPPHLALPDPFGEAAVGMRIVQFLFAGDA